MAKKPLPQEPAPLRSLGDLLRQRGVDVGDPAADAAAPPPPGEPGALDLTRARKLIVRRERKGHGGKTVTVVDGLALSPAKLEELARAMRKALGCGSWVEEGRIVLQGDRPDTAVACLTRRGAPQVVRGN